MKMMHENMHKKNIVNVEKIYIKIPFDFFSEVFVLTMHQLLLAGFSTFV